ncbi:MAG TPA: hypothetical protein VFK57_06035 [Vicinamibacterales bacterium]|nr:hypothetical protein [Vicinamibacterales bacterium]
MNDINRGAPFARREPPDFREQFGIGERLDCGASVAGRHAPLYHRHFSTSEHGAAATQRAQASTTLDVDECVACGERKEVQDPI